MAAVTSRAISRCPGRASAPGSRPTTSARKSSVIGATSIHARRTRWCGCTNDRKTVPLVRSLEDSLVTDELERGVELVGVEVRPRLVGEVDGRAGRLPQHEVRHPPLAARAHQDVDRRQLGEVERVADRIGRDRRARLAESPDGVDQLDPGAVVEGDREQHPGVAAGVGDRLADGGLDERRGAGTGGVERPTDPLDPHVQVVELGDPAEQALVQAEDVAHLVPRTHPVLGGEAEHREPADVALDGDPHDAGQVLLALGVADGARTDRGARPSARCRP